MTRRERQEIKVKEAYRKGKIDANMENESFIHNEYLKGYIKGRKDAIAEQLKEKNN